MQLTLSRNDQLIDFFPECPESVAPVFEFLPMEDKSFFILAKDDGSFLQGVWNDPDGVYLESHDAVSEVFSSSASCVSIEIAMNVTSAYRKLDPEWQRFCEWVHDETTESLEHESIGWMGHFEGVALHQVLQALERNNIPCGAMPDKSSFIVQVPPEHDANARRVIDELFSV